MATGKSIRALSAKEDVSVSDLNDLVYTGIYEYSGSSSNKPSSNGGIVFCLFNWNNQGVQIARANHEQALRLRYNVAGTWGSWGKIPMIQSITLTGTTDSDGDIGIPITTDNHSIVSAVQIRETTSDQLYFCVPTGKSGNNYIMKVFNDSFEKASNTAIKFRIDYVDIS